MNPDLEESKKLRTKPRSPSEVALENSPQLKARLDYLVEQEPSHLKSLLKSPDDLLAHLRVKANSALNLIARLIRQGKTQEEAEEAALAYVLAPSDVDPPEEGSASNLSPDDERRLEQFQQSLEIAPLTYQTAITE